MRQKLRKILRYFCRLLIVSHHQQGSLMESHNPYSPPTAVVLELNEQPTDEMIENLPISAAWKERFKAIAHAGGPKLPNLKNLPKPERRKAFSFNILAYLFGPIYYLSKGMWKKSITYLILSVAIVIALSLLLDSLGYPELSNALKYGVSTFYALRANIDFYKKTVLHSNGWW